MAAEAAEETPDATVLLGTARRTLEAQSGTDPALGELAARLEEAATLVADVSAELSAYLATLDADPARLQHVYERRAALRALTRKYADDVDGVIAWADRARTRLSDLDTSDDVLDELDREGQRLAVEVAELAGRVSASRQEAAVRFADQVTVGAGRAGHAARADRGGGAAPPGRACRADAAGQRRRGRRQRRTAATRWSCGCWPTRARRRCRCSAAPPAVSCPG